MKIPFFKPSIGKEEIKELLDTMESGWITTGPKVKLFEKEFSDYIGSKNSIAVNSCTSGLHLSLVAFGIGPGDEVIVPSLTFCSTVNVILHVGATPVLADIDDTLNISIDEINRLITPKTKVIIPVHYGGNACNLNGIYKIAAERNLVVIEDCAHAIGTSHQGCKIGADHLQDIYPKIKRTSVFSFYATKNITTAEGGMITTNNTEIADFIRILSFHGMNNNAWKRYDDRGSWFYQVVAPGFKYNMMDIQASLGIHQLRKIETMNKKRHEIAMIYKDNLIDREDIILPWLNNDIGNSYHLYPIQVKRNRNKIIEELKRHGIGTSVHFIPIHMHPYFSSNLMIDKNSLSHTTTFFTREISLPIYPDLSNKDVMYIIKTLKLSLEGSNNE